MKTTSSRCRHGQEDGYRQTVDEGLDSLVWDVTRNVWLQWAIPMYAYETSSGWRSGSWIRRQLFKLDGKRARLHRWAELSRVHTHDLCRWAVSVPIHRSRRKKDPCTISLISRSHRGGGGAVPQETHSTGNGARCSVMRNREDIPCSRVHQDQNDKIVRSQPSRLINEGFEGAANMLVR